MEAVKIFLNKEHPEFMALVQQPIKNGWAVFFSFHNSEGQWNYGVCESPMEFFDQWEYIGVL